MFRQSDAGWQPIGDLLPEWEHAPPRPHEPMSVWVLPNDQGYAVGDVIAFAETAHRLLSPVPKGDAAWAEVIDAASLLHEADHVREWLGWIELWLCLGLEGDWRDH